MLRHRLDPLRVDTRGDAAPQAAGFHQLRYHRPLRRLFKQPGARENREAGVARAGVLLFIGIFHADMRQQAGEERGVHLAITCRFAVYRNAELFHHLAQLGVDILPLAHAQIVKVIGAAQTAELVRGERLLLLAEVVPQVHERQEIGLFIVEAAVFFIGRLLFIQRALARILNRERRGNNHRLTHAAVLLRLQHHARQTRVHRQLRKLTAQRRELIDRRLRVRGNGPELFQQAYAILNIALVRRFDKRERRDIAQTQRGHLQNNGRQVGAQDFRVGKFRAREEVVFGIQPDTDAFRDAAAAPFTLVGGGLGDRLNRQALHFGAIAVTADARGAGVDDIFNARHGQRGFRYVRGEHNAPP
ncbi:putative periplasmic protein kinase ArgK and related GTPases of G3E family [Cronobacter dublinensis 582]|nr:putative periplasmic protein kinase ArgK and related GTPases of G3E family [Cronobacter dublinensis 582]